MKIRFSAVLILFLTAITLNVKGQMSHVPGELLVQIHEGVDINELASDYSNPWGLQTEKMIAAPMRIYKLQFEANTDENLLLRQIRQDARVSLAQFNHYVTRRCEEINDPQYVEQWHHNNSGQNGGLEDADIDSDLAWGLTRGGTTALGDTIVVCVIEGGNLNHPDLESNAWKNNQEIPNNNIDDDNNGYIDDYLGWDVQSNSDGGSVLQGNHGTNVMGMIGARGGNGQNVIGANWDVKIMSVSGENIFQEASVISAYMYPLVMRIKYNETQGDSGAFVVATNASWGIDNGNPDDVPLWNAMYDSLGVYGILNCGATANNNVNIDVVGDIPTALPSDYMVSVTATNSSDVRTFSGFGQTTVDLGAPGQAVVTTSGNGGITSTSGTSFASPLTAGVIALLYSAPCESFAEFVRNDPQGGADWVKQVLYDGVDVVPNLITETVTGGRLNAFNSLLLIMDDCEDLDLCLPPVGFSSTLENDTIYTLSWSDIPQNGVTIRFKLQNEEEWTVIEGVVDESLVIDTLSRCSTYDFEIGNSCEDGGEVVYTSCLTIETLGCCVLPESFEAETEIETEALVEWSTDFGIESYNVYYRELGSTDWILFGNYPDENEAIVDGLLACTEYEFLVSPACAENQDEGVVSQARTKGCGACLDNEYCENFSNNSSEEHIESVAVGPYEFVTGDNGGYALFENFEITLGAGQTYDATVTPGFPGQSFPEFIKIWIDLNHDGVFSESDELLLSSTEGSSDPLVGEITIPDDAILGPTRMRVAMKYVGGFIADNVETCENYQWGETEDYCMTIADVTSTTEENLLTQFSLYPNPTESLINIDFQLSRTFVFEGAVFTMFDISGKMVLQQNISEGNSILDIGVFDNGMYLYEIRTIGGIPLKKGKLVKGR